MTGLLDNRLIEDNWPIMDWYSNTSDMNYMNTNNLNNRRFPSAVSGLDLPQYSDVLDEPNLHAVNLDDPTYIEQLPYSFQASLENRSLLNSPFPLHSDFPNELAEGPIPSTGSSSPLTVDSRSSSPPPPKRRASRAQNTNLHSRQRTLHNAVERRYRDNMNAKFLALAQKMPTVYGDNAEVVMGRKPPKRKAGELYQSKTDVLDHTLSYIDQLHKDKEALAAQVASLGKTLQAALAERPSHKSGNKG